MSVAGVRGPRGNGRPGHADPVEAIALANGDAGFGLQRTAAHYVQLPMVNPSAVVGAVLVDLSVLPGSLPSLMNNLIVQADFAARFAAARRFLVAGVEHIRWVSAIPGGGGIDVPIEATDSTVEHMITVREGLSVIEHCQTLDPGGIFVAASIHTDVSRMPTGDAKHFMRNLFHYISTATRQQLIADNLDWILFWEWSAYDELSKVSEGVTDGPGGPVIIGPPRSAGDMHAEGLLFVRAGYEGPYDINPNAMAGWAALNTMLLARGALDGYYIIPAAPHARHGMYFKPFVLPRWALHLPDRNEYNGVLHWHNYIMRGTIWRQSSSGRSIRATNNQLAAMYVRRQRAINTGDCLTGFHRFWHFQQRRRTRCCPAGSSLWQSPPHR